MQSDAALRLSVRAFLRLLDNAPAKPAHKVTAVTGVGVNVIATAKLPGKIVERVIDLAVSERRPVAHCRPFRNAADAKPYRGSRNHRCNRADGKIAMALRHLGESVTGARLTDWESYRGHHLIGLTSGRKHANLKFFRGQNAGSPGRLKHHAAPQRRQTERQLRTWIRMRDTAAYSAAAAGLEMPDMRHGQAQQ